MKSVSISYSTRDFELCHMKQPRGFGNWAFQYKNEEPVFVLAKYSEAKKIAAERIKAAHPEASYLFIKVLG